MLKYRVNKYKDDIEEVEVTRETKCQVVLTDGRRAAKDTDWDAYFDTFEDARAYIVKRLTDKSIKLEASLETVRHKISNVIKWEKSSSNNA